MSVGKEATQQLTFSANFRFRCTTTPSYGGHRLRYINPSSSFCIMKNPPHVFEPSVRLIEEEGREAIKSVGEDHICVVIAVPVPLGFVVWLG